MELSTSAVAEKKKSFKWQAPVGMKSSIASWLRKHGKVRVRYVTITRRALYFQEGENS